MIAPILITGGILSALYATRGMPSVVRPGKRYLLGFPQRGVDRPATAAEIEVARGFVEEPFRDVSFAKTTTEDGERIYWFKATWHGEQRRLRPASEVRVYEVLF